MYDINLCMFTYLTFKYINYMFIIIYQFLATYVSLSHCRPQGSYSKGITSYGTPVSANALNINLESNFPPKNDLQNGEIVKNDIYRSSAETHKSNEEIKPLNDEYQPVSAKLPLTEKFNGNRPAPVIHKHVYVHVAPPEEEEESEKSKSLPPPPEKHYRIIFIQAPSPKSSKFKIQLPETEEKTIIYVLVKKSDDDSEVELPPATPTNPSKPEVYFIRYKTKEEAISTIADAAKTTLGHTDKKFNKIGVPTEVISGGSISDALLGAGTIPNFGNDVTTEKGTTIQDNGTSGPYQRAYEMRTGNNTIAVYIQIIKKFRVRMSRVRPILFLITY